MKSSESKDDLIFNYHTIRLLVGLIALLFPWVVAIIAAQFPPPSSISWSYYTPARDIFVGLLFVLGAFLISYKGREHIIHKKDVHPFWHWLNKYWKGAINFRIVLRKHEENLVSWVGGIAGWAAALSPTAYHAGENFLTESPASRIHHAGAIILFSTTVYFCLVAFRHQAKAKMKPDQALPDKGGNDPEKRRIRVYSFCGVGIAVIMLLAVVASFTEIDKIFPFTFSAEAVALELFGFAWMVASQYLPFFTAEKERQKTFLEKPTDVKK